MKKKYIAAIDSGKRLTKMIIAETEKNEIFEKEIKISVPTKLTEVDDNFSDEVQKESYIVEFENKKHVIGKQGLDVSSENNKALDIHKLSVYCALSEVLEPDVESEITAVLACPVLTLNDKSDKTFYKEFITNSGKQIEIKINDKNYKFKFVNSIIKSETTGIRYLNDGLFKNKKIALIDFGGLNLTFVEMDDEVVIPENRFSDKFGFNRLVTDTVTALSAYTKDNVSTRVAEKSIELGYLINDGIDSGSKKVINSVKEKFIENMVKEIELKRISLKNYQQVIFLGGTSIYLQDQLSARFKNSYFVEDPQWASVYGLFEIAKELVKC